MNCCNIFRLQHMQTYFVVALTFFCGALLCFVLLLILFYLQPFGVSATQYTLSLPQSSPLSHSLSFFYHHCSLHFPSLPPPPLFPLPLSLPPTRRMRRQTFNCDMRGSLQACYALALSLLLSLSPLPPLSRDASPSQLHMKPAQLQLL